MKIELRDYVCPVCSSGSKHSTNHEGEIYTGCNVCGGSVLNFKDSDKVFKPMFKINFYEFDLSTIEGHYDYKLLCNELNEEYNFKCFNTNLSPRHSKTFWDSLKKDSEVISVHEPETFEDQFITDKGRLHNWYESVYPNKRIKRGYYLTLDQRNM